MINKRRRILWSSLILLAIWNLISQEWGDLKNFGIKGLSFESFGIPIALLAWVYIIFYTFDKYGKTKSRWIGAVAFPALLIISYFVGAGFEFSSEEFQYIILGIAYFIIPFILICFGLVYLAQKTQDSNEKPVQNP